MFVIVVGVGTTVMPLTGPGCSLGLMLRLHTQQTVRATTRTARMITMMSIAVSIPPSDETAPPAPVSAD